MSVERAADGAAASTDAPGVKYFDLDPDGDVLVDLVVPPEPFALWDKAVRIPLFKGLSEPATFLFDEPYFRAKGTRMKRRNPTASGSTHEGERPPKRARLVEQPPDRRCVSFAIIKAESKSGRNSHSADETTAEPTEVRDNIILDGLSIDDEVKPEENDDGSTESDDAEDSNSSDESDDSDGSSCSASGESTRKLRVSSKHLMLASPYLKELLSKSAGSEESDPPLRTIVAHGVDAEELVLLLYIIHNRTRDVPRTLSIEQLAKVAVLVDVWQCHDAVALFSEIWLQHFKKDDLPVRIGRSAILLTYISWIFKAEKLFDQMTALAIMECRGPLQTLGLPFPDRLIDLLEEDRIAAISAAFTDLEDLVNDFLEDRESCSFECASMHLGALIKQLHSRNLWRPRPEAPFIGISINHLKLSLSHILSSRSVTGCYGKCPSLEQLISPITKKLDAENVGLEFEMITNVTPVSSPRLQSVKREREE